MPRSRSLLWQIFPSYLFIILLSILAISWVSFSFIRQFYLDEMARELEERSRMVAVELDGSFNEANEAEVDRHVELLGRDTHARTTIILPNGRVIGDSEEDPQSMDNHARRPEIAKALNGKVGQATRFSDTVKLDMMYVAVPIYQNQTLLGVVRSSMPVRDLTETLSEVYQKILFGGLFVAILSALIALGISKQLKRPIERLIVGAQNYAKGYLSYEIPVPHTEEIAELANAMKEMATQLGDRIRTISEQREELEAVLSGMIEAVIVVDRDFKIERLNKAASRMLEIDIDDALSSSIFEVSDNRELHRFVEQTLNGDDAMEEDLIFKSGGGEIHLSANGAHLRNAAGEKIGALIVLHDVTNLKRLEKIRRDFVANVSHELKTPITSIKGFAETLMDGAIEDPEQADHFLRIVVRHAERLSAIIDDLLSLSRIEQAVEKSNVHLARGRIKDVIEAAMLVCESKANDSGIRIETFCEPDLQAMLNPLNLEQALINLIDNAIKYSEPESEITVRAYRTEKDAVVEVSDQGCGIPKEDLPRIFERFYRVDKARSRKQGGTGLGLAIVKHIAASHNGSVTVESAPGVGSTFRIHIPALV